MYNQNAGFPVYCSDCWWSDNWDPMDYGQDFDFTKTFLENFKKLEKVVPKINLVVGGSENSKFTNFAWKNKDSYLIFASDYNQDCFYGNNLLKNTDCVDTTFSLHSQLSYECIDSRM